MCGPGLGDIAEDPEPFHLSALLFLVCILLYSRSKIVAAVVPFKHDR